MAIESRIWGLPEEDCRLSLGPPDLKVKAGQLVEVQLTFRNDGAKQIGFPRSAPWQDYKFNLLHNDQPVPLTRFGEHVLNTPAVDAATMVWLAPGQEYTSTSIISRVFDMSMPGRYTLEVSKELMRRSGTGFMKVVSNQITIEVVED
ncbi:hypothetical protein [Sorangium sp. So ce1099]|uniref:hypothetical protein n=1 Tax=Sorangium sp. So ce1099 TaxID=3133331 RepID=UPI003F5DA8AE